MRKILLIAPNNPQTTRFQMLTAGITMPLGLGYLASYLKAAGFDVSILDNSVENLSVKEVIARLSEYNPDIVGLSALTYAVPNALRLAKVVKEFNPSITVIMGGGHATALAEDLLRDKSVDVVVRGEGENTLLELVICLSNGNDLSGVNGIVYRKSNENIVNPCRELIQDLDSIPFPAYELLPVKKYFLPSSRCRTNRTLGSIVTSRGCVFRCSFCSRGVFGDEVRFRSPENVIEEIQLLVNRYKIGELIFWDDNFALDRERALKICKLMLEKKLNIVWSCNNRISLFSEEICRAFSEAGCRTINFGVESGSQAIRKQINKDFSSQDIFHAVRLCRKYKLAVSCSFIFGLPGEGMKEALETLKLAIELNPDYAIFCILVPMPGSELFDQAVREGLIDEEKQDWERYVTLLSAAPPVISLGGLSRDDLMVLQKMVFRKFYFRGRYIHDLLLRMHSFNDVKVAFRGIHAILRHQIAAMG
ncbi:MAG: radical SAM protein [Candidatus Omnitrophota bacterium]|nr:B12-binding domain-containing radical SAM protein [Candidatus Omnitrophota bacterium]